MALFRSLRAQSIFIVALTSICVSSAFSQASAVSVTVSSNTTIPSQGLKGSVGGGWGSVFSATASGAPIQGSECTATSGGQTGPWSGPSWIWRTEVTAGSGGTSNGLSANDPDDGSASSQVNLNYYSKGTYTVKVIAKVTYTSVCGDDSGEGSKSFNVKIIQPVSSVTVQTVTFGSSKDVLKDQGTSFPSTHWERGRSEQSPVCYVRAETVKAGATFSVSPQNADQPIKIKGVASSYIFNPQSKTPSNGSTSYSSSGASQALPNHITSGGSFNITWYYSTDNGGTWNAYGSSISDATSANTLYATLKTPTESLYLTTLRLSSAGNNGQSNPDVVVPNIWDQFSGRSVSRTTKANSSGSYDLTYWGDGIYSVATASGLLKSFNGSGRCGAWQDLFFLAASAQGLTVDKVTINPDMLANGYKGKRFVIFSNLPGQNNSKPQDEFNDHAVIKWSSSTGQAHIYDPSYGIDYKIGNFAEEELLWENNSVSSFAYDRYSVELGGDIEAYTINTKELKEAKFTPFTQK